MRAPAQDLDRFRSGRPQARAPVAEGVQKLHQNHLGCDKLGEVLRGSHRFVVKFVARIKKRDPIAGIGEHALHEDVFEAP
jgi:hypothetical protein